MKHILTSEWLKLRRKGMAGALAATVGVSILGAVIALMTATDRTTTPGPGASPTGGSTTTIASLSSTDGLATALTQTSTLLGVVALAVVAGSVAGEYSFGTLRNLLVHEPRRVRLLHGKLVALAVAVVAALALASLVTCIVASAVAGNQGIETSLWFSTDGVAATLVAVAQLTLATLGWGLFGAVLALAVRSPVVAIGVGVAYALPGEAILRALPTDVSRWLPGQVLAAVGSGGSDSMAYAIALVTMLVYAAVALAAASVAFARRDVAF